LPVLQRLIFSYKLWHSYWVHFDKLTKFSLGSKIDSLFLETIQNIFVASCRPQTQRGPYINKASDTFDILKFILQVAWELGSLDNKKYIALSQPLSEVGRMLGGWQRKNNHPAK